MSSTTMVSYLRLDLWDQSAAIRSGKLKSTALVEEYRRNIDRHDDFYNVFVHLEDERALQAAAVLDAELEAGQLRGPLHSIPLAVKDNVDTLGVDTTAGSRVLEGSRPGEDAPLVARLREAGAVIVGKTNMDEFAYGFTTENRHYGNARNPYDPERVAGGSSGGSALAVALAMSSGAIGTDTNGSIRVPASLCGLTGLRPTYGRVSRRGVVPLAASFDQARPITHSARDAALILSVIAGHDPEDPESRDLETPNYPAALEAPCPSFRIGVPNEHFFEGADDAVVSSVRAVLEKLASESQDLVELTLNKASTGRESAALITAVESASAATDEMLKSPELFDVAVLGRLKSRLKIPHSDYEEAREHAAAVRKELMKTFETVDFTVTPTCPLLPIRIGEEPCEIDGLIVSPSSYLGHYTSVFGLAHLPAMSMPCGFSPNGLPIGTQLVGAPYQETKLLQLARLIERTTGLVNLRPPSG